MMSKIEYRMKKSLKIKFQHLLTVFFLLVNVLFSNAQNTLSSSDILASAKQQYVLDLQQQRVDFLKNSKFKLPL